MKYLLKSAAIQSVAVALVSLKASANDSYCLINLAAKPDWQALGAIGSFIAAGVAVAIAIGIEIWRRKEQRRFSSQCKVRLAAETAGIARSAVVAFVLLDTTNGPLLARHMPPTVRPTADAIIPRMFDMEDQTVIAAALYEGHLRSALTNAEELNKAGNKRQQELRQTLVDILIISAKYVRKLYGREHKALNFFIAEEMKTEVPPDMIKMIGQLEFYADNAG